MLKLNLGCGRTVHPDWVNVDFQALAPKVVAHDLRRPLPFKNGSCSAVYASHVLEHFPRSFAPVFLGECHRVLARGGVLRAVVPDLETIARLYIQQLEGALLGDPKAAERYEWIILELLDQMVRERSGGDMSRYWLQEPMPAKEFVLERVGREALQFLEMLEPGARPASPPAPAPDPTPQEAAQFRAQGEVHKWMYDRYSLRVLLQKVGFKDVAVCAAHESRIQNFVAYQLDTCADGSVRKPDSLFMEALKA